MKISQLKVKNFRLLHDVSLQLEKQTTVVVGRNNCGKTSLSDVIKKFLSEKSSFEIEDFSSASYENFCAAHRAYLKNADPQDVRALIPTIELRIHVKYDPAVPEFGPLQEFVIDTDDTCTEAVIVCPSGERPFCAWLGACLPHERLGRVAGNEKPLAG